MYGEVCGKCQDFDERDFFEKDGYLWIPSSETER